MAVEWEKLSYITYMPSGPVALVVDQVYVRLWFCCRSSVCLSALLLHQAPLLVLHSEDVDTVMHDNPVIDFV